MMPEACDVGRGRGRGMLDGDKMEQHDGRRGDEQVSGVNDP